MEIIYTEEFLEYKLGFVNGKEDVMNLVFNGVDYYVEEGSDTWYSIGYNDGYQYYHNLFTTKGIVYSDEIIGRVPLDILNEFFRKRVIEYNTNTEEEIPSVIYKLSPQKGTKR